MHIIEWESHIMNESYELVFNSSFWKGRVYNLLYNNQAGSIVTKPAYAKGKDCIIGYGYFKSTEIVMQSMEQHVDYRTQVFNKTNLKEPIAYFDYGGFWLYSVFYDVDIKIKDIFSKRTDFDVKLSVGIGSSKNLFTLEVNFLNKKWYYPASYFNNINGQIQLKNEPNWEFIIVVFLYLDHYIEVYLNSD